MASKEPLRLGKTLRGYQDVSSPAQNKRTPPFTAYPIAELISDNGPEDAEYDGVPYLKVPLLGCSPGSYEDGFSRERNPAAL